MERGQWALAFAARHLAYAGTLSRAEFTGSLVRGSCKASLAVFVGVRVLLGEQSSARLWRTECTCRASCSGVCLEGLEI